MHNTVRVYRGDADFGLTGSTDAECLFELKGGLVSQRNTTVYKSDGDEEAGKAHEKRSNLGGLFGADEYELNIQPGNDAALIIAAMVVYDEIMEDQAEAAERAQ